MGRSPQRDRGPDHLSAFAQAARPGRRQGGALVVRVQLLDDHPHLRGQHRLLLRPRARAGAADHWPAPSCREGSRPTWPPDATALGQIFWYTLDGGDLDPGRRWALQKFYVGPELNSVPGVAEVGTVGGMPCEYQIDVDPDALRPTASRSASCTTPSAAATPPSAAGHRRRTTPNTSSAASAGSTERPGTSKTPSSSERGGTPIYVKNVADGAARHRSSAAASSRRTATRRSAAWC